MDNDSIHICNSIITKAGCFKQDTFFLVYISEKKLKDWTVKILTKKNFLCANHSALDFFPLKQPVLLHLCVLLEADTTGFELT